MRKKSPILIFYKKISSLNTVARILTKWPHFFVVDGPCGPCFWKAGMNAASCVIFALKVSDFHTSEFTRVNSLNSIYGRWRDVTKCDLTLSYHQTALVPRCSRHIKCCVEHRRFDITLRKSPKELETKLIWRGNQKNGCFVTVSLFFEFWSIGYHLYVLPSILKTENLFYSVSETEYSVSATKQCTSLNFV